MFRGEQKILFVLIKAIAASQGLKGFWKGNFVNILYTAPFKAANFYAYDTYRNHLLRMSGNEEITNFERFLAGAIAGITATVLCIPMDTTNLSECEGPEKIVIRRYSDFIWLRDHLFEKYKGIFIPPLPEEHCRLFQHLKTSHAKRFRSG
ncbi:probable mitochondrial adenine nucleotide transporter BTL2 isoform X6 [Camellia sinensis]|uniref:probable mitochondrial adenine nucleotide transporter BTL2 isoform X6 n=1 Tax=Camellia sinensis TaxID=4442 RepID=UPI001035E577|nr:probable mitochondrial adenine nucleotide transporter BTL2 isoform X6 [Camellia sinensis]